MNKQGKTKLYVGFLTVVILLTSIYIFLPNNVRIDVGKTYSTFKVWENESWVLAGTERTILMDSSAIMRAKSRNVEYFIEDNITTIIRTANFKNNITAIDTYMFDGGTKNVELFPISHTIKIINAKNAQTELNKNTEFILVYEVKDLLYSDETINGISSPQEFGHKMKIEWEEGNYYSKIYKYSGKDEGKLTIKYRIDSNDFEKDVKLFDPPIEGNDLIIANGQTVTLGGNNDTYDTVWVQTGGTLQIDSTDKYLNLTANNITIDGEIRGYNLIFPAGSGGSTSGYTAVSGGSGTGEKAGSGGSAYLSGDYSASCGGGGAGGAVAGQAGLSIDSYRDCTGGSAGSQIGTTANNYDKTVWNGSAGGGGGGASQNGNNAAGGTGGTGAGWIIMKADNIKISGSVLFNGNNGANGYTQDYGDAGAGGGGGGSGGTILIDSIDVNLSSGTLSVAGGSYGAGTRDGYYTMAPSRGGAGAGGRIKIFSSSLENDSTTITIGTGSYFYADVPLSLSNLTSNSINNFTTEDIRGYCNGTVNESRNMTYYWNLYLDDVLNQSGNTGDVTEQINVVNISSNWLIHNDTWKLECIVSDYTYNTTDSYELQVHQPIWINITNPAEGAVLQGSYHTIEQDFENYTELDSCWYTNDSGVTNQSITCGENITANWLDGLNEVTIYSNSTNYYNETINFDSTTGEIFSSTYTGQVNKAGLKITVNEDLYNILSITVESQTYPTYCYIYDSLGTTQIVNSTFSGRTCTFPNFYELTKGEQYWLVVDKEGSSFRLQWNDGGGSYPYNSGGLSITEGTFNLGVSSGTNHVPGIKNIGITQLVPSNYETSDSVSFTTVIGPADIEYIEPPTPDNDTWLSQDYLNIATYISNCESFKNATYYLRSVIIDIMMGVLDE